MKNYIVQGWLNGKTYEAGAKADFIVKVYAANETEADHKGDKKIARKHGKCDVIISSEV